MFEKMLNDEYIIKMYDEVTKVCEINEWVAHHNLIHVKNVIFTVETVLKKLGYDDEFIEEAKIAALLHDIGCVEGKTDHANVSYKIAKKYFEENNIKLKYHDLVLDAIKDHRNGFDSENMMTLSIIFADKLDIKYDRLAKPGHEEEGVRQLKHIRDIKLDISEKYLAVNFITDEFVNQEELEGYYFLPKVFKSIRSFAKKINLEPIINLNNKVWNKF